jgi:hypothetical protein
MLKGMDMFKNYWAEVESTAVYLLNQAPTKALDSVTPEEAWLKRKPTVKHFRIFGSTEVCTYSKTETKKT